MKPGPIPTTPMYSPMSASNMSIVSKPEILTEMLLTVEPYQVKTVLVSGAAMTIPKLDLKTT